MSPVFIGLNPVFVDYFVGGAPPLLLPLKNSAATRKGQDDSVLVRRLMAAPV